MALALTVVVVAFLVWLFAGGGVWRGGVRVVSAMLQSPTRLVLFVDACHADSELTLLRETDAEVQVKVVASTTPFRGGPDCADGVEVDLKEPLGGRVVIDKHTGRSVEVTIAR